MKITKAMRDALVAALSADAARFAGGVGYVAGRTSVKRALRVRGLIDERGYITPAGREAVA